ncbi:porin [Lacimicrobium sp. SS2-24]|uniref:porin n=1 Tax=Lacimicrobium sp. SS2-24 TaxID=2005569 RepID=UPI000B4B8BF9|nr:porin [Lacimicrobium sp. SS2-24]
MKTHYLLPTALLILSAPATAEITFNGFGSIVAGVSEDSPFRNNLYDDDVSFRPQSKLALQASADLGEGLSVTAQIMARGADDFDAEFEWAYLSYDISDSTTLRAGRLRIPFYRYSDYLDVGFAYPFISPPRTMYSLTFSTYEGLSLLHNFSMSSVDVNVNLVYGRVEETFFPTTNPTKGTLSDIAGFNTQASWQSFTGYVTYLRTDVTIPVPAIEGLAAQLNQAGVPGSLTEQLRINEDKGSFFGFGLSYDDGDWVFNSEKSEVSIDDSLNLTSDQWYVNLGHRFGEFLPYFYYGEIESERNTSIPSQFPASLQPTIQGAFDSQYIEYTETGIGVRWDFHATTALKVEFTKYDDIWDRNPATALGTADNKESMNQLRVGVDFIF